MKITMFALEMVDQRKEGEWTAKMQFENFTHYWKKAAQESLGKLVCGLGKRKMHSCWDEEVKEAIKRRNQECREHSKCRNLHERFPDMVTEETVKKKLTDYLKQKWIAKDVARKKRDEERETVLEEARSGGRYNSTVFCERAKRKSSKAPKRLKDKSGKVYDSEEAMTEIACEHFERIERGYMDEEGESSTER